MTCPGNWWAPAALAQGFRSQRMQLDKEAEKLGDEIRKNVDRSGDRPRARRLQLVAGLVRTERV